MPALPTAPRLVATGVQLDFLYNRVMIAYFDCFSGISGDMALGALVDAGLPLETLKEEVGKLEVGGYRFEVSTRSDQGIRGTQLTVVLDDALQPERRLRDIVGLLQAGRLDSAVADQARAVFERLARAEASVHGVSPEDVHFHEVGAVDAIVDVVGTVAGLRALGVDRVYASALPLGNGTVTTRHGIIPLPAPGTLALIAEAAIPTRVVASDRELVTPTGAALLAELATFEQPPMRPGSIGYGYGQRVLSWPNCARLWLGEPLAPQLGRDEVVLIEANLDDMTPEALGFAMEQLFEAGALDVYFQQLQMKKNRPGVLLGVLARPAQAADLAARMLAETSTLGVRMSRLERVIAARHGATVTTPFGPLEVKVKRIGGRRVVSPEYDDAARIAREHAVPLAEVYRLAQLAEPEP